MVADIALTSEAKELIDGSDRLVYQETDVSKWPHLHRLVTVAKEKFGSTPDVYVAGAGVSTSLQSTTRRQSLYASHTLTLHRCLNPSGVTSGMV